MLARMVSISLPNDLPALASQSAEITGLSHRAWPTTVLIFSFSKEAEILNSDRTCPRSNSLVRSKLGLVLGFADFWFLVCHGKTEAFSRSRHLRL